jgi:hypothetical protein
MGYYYGIQAFALAIVVLTPHPEVAKWLYREPVAVTAAALMLVVFVDMSYAPGPSNPALLPIRVGFWLSWALGKVPFSHAATQPQV